MGVYKDLCGAYKNLYAGYTKIFIEGRDFVFLSLSSPTFGEQQTGPDIQTRKAGATSAA